MLLSGEFNFILVLSGVIASCLVAYMSHDLLFGKIEVVGGSKRVLAFIKYIPWLMYQIALSNIDLVYRTLHPKKPINPGIIKVKNDFSSDLGMVLFANSVTLTPGTVTIEVNDNEFIIHAIAKDAAEDMNEGQMLKKIKEIECIT